MERFGEMLQFIPAGLFKIENNTFELDLQCINSYTKRWRVDRDANAREEEYNR